MPHEGDHGRPTTPGSAAFGDVPTNARNGRCWSRRSGCAAPTSRSSRGYGWAPPGEDRLVLGHESLGRVIDPGPRGRSGGDLVVGVVRRPDPVPCPSCAVGEWDMCPNGVTPSAASRQIDGFMSERWRIEPEYVIRLDPASASSASSSNRRRSSPRRGSRSSHRRQRTFWDPHRVLVAGAGPIGLLAALLGRQRGLRSTCSTASRPGPKPGLVRELGATYHSGTMARPRASSRTSSWSARASAGDPPLPAARGRGRHRVPHRRRHGGRTTRPARSPRRDGDRVEEPGGGRFA